MNLNFIFWRIILFLWVLRFFTRILLRKLFYIIVIIIINANTVINAILKNDDATNAKWAIDKPRRPFYIRIIYLRFSIAEYWINALNELGIINELNEFNANATNELNELNAIILANGINAINWLDAINWLNAVNWINAY